MPRSHRIELAGGIFHVTSRGDRREEIYLDDYDRRTWLSILGKVCSRFNWICQSYCLMDNHYHLILETVEANLSCGMRQLNGVYAQAFNTRHRLVGHVFQGRYKSILIERDTYLLELARYVVLNPVRAKKTDGIRDWPWCSFCQIIGEMPSPSWLNSDWTLYQFHNDIIEARKRFEDFVRAGIGLPSIWDELKNDYVLGSEEYIDALSEKFPIIECGWKIKRQSEKGTVRDLSEYEQSISDRRMAMAEAYRSGEYTMTQIANYFSVNQSTVSRAVKAFDNRSGYRA